MDTSMFPPLNATLNGISTLFLLTGYYFIRKKDIAKHRAMMISAFGTSVIFLVSYLTYHLNVKMITTFSGEGLIRVLYFIVLISHSVLAAIVPFMVVITIYRGLKMNVERHRFIARWTLPVWLYVSVTGVLVYLMLYQFNA